MVLGYFGRRVGIHEVRDGIDAGRGGANALALMQAARRFGLRARAVKVGMADLPFVSCASILHWEFNHFVVFERLADRFAYIVDPAVGGRRVTLDHFSTSFTGVALLFEPGEAFQTRRAAPLPAWSYVKSLLSDGDQLPRIVVTSFLLQLFALAAPAFAGTIVDRVVPRADYHLLGVLSCGYASIAVFGFLSTLVRAHLLVQWRTHMDVRLTMGFVEHLLSLPFKFFQQRAHGDLMMRLSSNATIREIVTSGAVSALIDGSLVLLYLLLLFVVNPTIGCVALCLAMIQLGVLLATRRRQKELMSEMLHVQALSQSYQFEMLSGIETIKAMGAEQQAIDRWTNLFVDTTNVSLQRGALNATLEAIVVSMRQFAPFVVLAIATEMVLDGSLTLGTAIGINALAMAFLSPIATLVTTANQLQLFGSYFERVYDVLSVDSEEGGQATVDAGSLEGGISVDDVSFRYEEAGPLVLKRIDLRVEPGQFVAIVGPSGSGKSTLAALLLALYRPTSGHVLFDGRDLSTMNIGMVRRQCGIVLQHTYMFSGSIRSNIAMSDPTASLDDVVSAAKVAGLHDEIAAMPMGYNTLVMENGGALSGGQAQRLALARALLRKPAILLLDEATSALDAVTEGEVQRGLQALECTRIVIAHRLSTIANADVILVMDKGSIVERGTHEELLARQGRYFDLVTRQISSRPAAE
jgi:ABC-type bacteriocin/lantibiotic exporter with double-glycine peptidase domain